MRFLYLLLLSVLGSSLSLAQPYTEDTSRYRFAQTYVGFTSQYTPAQGDIRWRTRGTSQSFASQYFPKLTFGGLHFWGRLDFTMSFTLAPPTSNSLLQNGTYEFQSGGDFGMRYYPFPVTYGKLRPYMGILLNFFALQMNDEQSNERIDSYILPSIAGGVSLALKGWQINAQSMWLLDSRHDFFVDPNTSRTLEFPGTFIEVGIVRYFDFTLSEEKGWKSGETARRAKELAERKKLNTFSLAIAPSMAFFLRAPSTTLDDRISLPRHKSNFLLDFGLGYLFYNPRLHIGFRYKDYTSNSVSYGLENLLRRTSIALEGFKFIWDYNGFVPFIGPSISYERWLTADFEGNTQVDETVRNKMISPGIIIGWDISTSPLETWTLRTNLRYFPFQKITDVEGNRVHVDQFEFNFIELVIYPQRFFN